VKLTFFVILALAVAFCPATQADEVAVIVASRHFLTKGNSNVHLYLYGLDGKLRRQLTNTGGLDDELPAFDYDGRTVIFTRSASDSAHRDLAGRYILDLGSGKLRRLSPGITHNEDEQDYQPSLALENLSGEDNLTWTSDPSLGADVTFIRSLDGAFTITSRPHPMPGDPGGGSRLILLRTKSHPKAVWIGDLPGAGKDADYSFESFYYGGLFATGNTPFICGSRFNAMFLSHHLDSTDGDAIWGLDLNARRWTQMSGNGGSIYHAPGGNGVFFVNSSLYEQWPGRKYHSIDCAYLEWRDANLKRSRLGPPLSSFYGAAIHFAPGQNSVISEITGS